MNGARLIDPHHEPPDGPPDGYGCAHALCVDLWRDGRRGELCLECGVVLNVRADPLDSGPPCEVEPMPGYNRQEVRVAVPTPEADYSARARALAARVEAAMATTKTATKRHPLDDNGASTAIYVLAASIVLGVILVLCALGKAGPLAAATEHALEWIGATLGTGGAASTLGYLAWRFLRRARDDDDRPALSMRAARAPRRPKTTAPPKTPGKDPTP